MHYVSQIVFYFIMLGMLFFIVVLWLEFKSWDWCISDPLFWFPGCWSASKYNIKTIFYSLFSVILFKIYVSCYWRWTGRNSSSIFFATPFWRSASSSCFRRRATIGGHLALIIIESQDYEAGGSVIHPRNELFGEYVNKNLKIKYWSLVDMQ